jgi:hypothetical protein
VAAAAVATGAVRAPPAALVPSFLAAGAFFAFFFHFHFFAFGFFRFFVFFLFHFEDEGNQPDGLGEG